MQSCFQDLYCQWKNVVVILEVPPPPSPPPLPPAPFPPPPSVVTNYVCTNAATGDSSLGCSISMPTSYTISVQTCENCVFDTVLTLKNTATSASIATADDTCGLCASLSYKNLFPNTLNVTISQRCYLDSSKSIEVSCGNVVKYTFIAPPPPPRPPPPPPSPPPPISAVAGRSLTYPPAVGKTPTCASTLVHSFSGHPTRDTVGAWTVSTNGGIYDAIHFQGLLMSSLGQPHFRGLWSQERQELK